MGHTNEWGLWLVTVSDPELVGTHSTEWYVAAYSAKQAAEIATEFITDGGDETDECVIAVKLVSTILLHSLRVWQRDIPDTEFIARANDPPQT